MAEQVLTNASVSIGGVDLSDHVRSVTLNRSADAPEITAMGDTTRNRLGGLLDWSMSVEFNQDYAANEVSATLDPLLGTVVAVVVKADAGATSTTNPSYSGNAVLTSIPGPSGAVGDAHTATATLEAAGDLTRATS